MIDDEQLGTYLLSLARCQADDRFLAVFYERFFASSDEVRRMFSNTDLRKQRRMLKTALNLLASGESHELRAIARSHGRYGLNVRSEQYDLWLDALLSTVKDTDPDFDSEIEAAWRGVLGHTIAMFRANY